MAVPPYSSATVTPEQAQAAELGPQVHGKFVRAVDLGGARGDLVGSEPAHRLAQRGDVLAVVEPEKRVFH